METNTTKITSLYRVGPTLLSEAPKDKLIKKKIFSYWHQIGPKC